MEDDDSSGMSLDELELYLGEKSYADLHRPLMSEATDEYDDEDWGVLLEEVIWFLEADEGDKQDLLVRLKAGLERVIVSG